MIRLILGLSLSATLRVTHLSHREPRPNESHARPLVSHPNPNPKTIKSRASANLQWLARWIVRHLERGGLTAIKVELHYFR